MKSDCVIIGGGIVGLSVALKLGRRQPGLRIVVLEKEARLASHQSGRNSGVIHSGIYYTPGSLKARFAREGNRSMIAFCQKYEIAHQVCGKIIVATAEKELPLLDDLYRRGLQNELRVAQLCAKEVQEKEPHVRCLRGLEVPSTAIVDFRDVCAKYAELIEQAGGVVRTGVEVTRIQRSGESHLLQTTVGEIEAPFLVNCAGLQSDRMARQAGVRIAAKIMPFRGEYYELAPARRHLVKALIYPVPNPSFPFLGVHLTKMIDGSVHAGPNAVLALQREGYGKTDVRFGDLLEMLTYKGLWRLVRKHYREGLGELHRSLSKKAFLRKLQQLVPELTESDLVPGNSGIRAQALMPDGTLVNDFLLLRGPNSIHVCNAPSPAATASLEIGKAVANQIPALRTSAAISLSV